MQVTVGSEYLNVRTGLPSVNAPNTVYKSPGDVIEIDGQLHKGDLYEGIDLWVKDLAGNFFWSGGVTGLYPNWMTALQIPSIWHYATGKGVGIAVVDTGIDLKNPDLIFDPDNFYIFDKQSSLQDTNGHGSHCSGLAGAKNKTGNIIGTAPDCNLFICKIAEGDTLPQPLTTRYADAINWCANQANIHIVSISWASMIFDAGILSSIQAAINFAIQKNKIVICAMGDASSFNDPGPLYPASLDNTIGIGSIPEENLFAYINKSLITSTHGYNILSYSFNGQTIHLTGTSQSNAIMAGVVALILQKKQLAYVPADINKLLTQVSTFQQFQGIPIPIVSGDLLLKYFQS